jgi:hypothetical protein
MSHPTYEYLVMPQAFRGGLEGLEARLNELGEQGWRVVLSSGTTTPSLILMRELPGVPA